MEETTRKRGDSPLYVANRPLLSDLERAVEATERLLDSIDRPPKEVCELCEVVRALLSAEKLPARHGGKLIDLTPRPVPPT